MAAFVLVHSPLVGPATWRGVAEVLSARGDEVVVPSLVAATSAGPPFTEGAVAAVLAALPADGPADPVVLAGHSGAGPLLPAVSAALGGAVSCHVFVDAGLPCPGRTRLADAPSFRDLLTGMVGEDGMLPPWHEWWDPQDVEAILPDHDLRSEVVAELVPVPFGLFEEPLPEVPGWPGAPCAYLRLSDEYAAEQASASALGWPVSSLPGSHLELVSSPRLVADAMSDLVRRCAGT